MKKYLIALSIAAGLSPLLAAQPSQAQAVGLTYWGIQLEEFEYRFGDEGEDLAAWDGDAYFGTDEFKFRLMSEGEYDANAGKFETLENRLVGQVPISDFFDAKAGIRLDTPKGQNRWYGIVGVAGLAPQWFEVDADLFLSDQGDLSARLDVEYELLITNRLILTPSAEINLAFSDDTEIEIKSGFTSLELGLRLSYDLIDRAFSPYVGLAFETKLGDTEDLISDEGEDTSAWFGVVGAKFVF
ncbi:MAG: copper resistance protein B [Alphaproteobacteria bacterium]|nr:copper resistance protein B [Alphaproteobacteria bacterium]